jgi:DNA repair protein RecN (Recombination protein N)
MLATLTIRDIVLIDRLELEFRPGLCALTGETGAGKSILLDALGLALGARSDARLVRHGMSQASVSAAFMVPAGHGACRILTEHEIDDNEGALVLRRVLTNDGRSRAFVNDQPVSRTLLRRVGEMLVEIHGQFESRRLLDAGHHRALLDAFGGLNALLEDVREARAGWREAAQQLSKATADLESARGDEEYLKHVVGELDAVGPRRGEEQELTDRRHVLMNAEKLVQAMDEAASALGGGGRSVDALIRGALRALERVPARPTANSMPPSPRSIEPPRRLRRPWPCSIVPWPTWTSIAAAWKPSKNACSRCAPWRESMPAMSTGFRTCAMNWRPG